MFLVFFIGTVFGYSNYQASKAAEEFCFVTYYFQLTAYNTETKYETNLIVYLFVNYVKIYFKNYFIIILELNCKVQQIQLWWPAYAKQKYFIANKY